MKIVKSGKELSKVERFTALHGKTNNLKNAGLPLTLSVSNYAILEDENDDKVKKLIMFTNAGMFSTSSSVVLGQIEDFYEFTTDPETSDGSGTIIFERVTSRNGMEYISMSI